MFYSSAQSCRIRSNQIHPPLFEGPGFRSDTCRDDWISQVNVRKKTHQECYGLLERLHGVFRVCFFLFFKVKKLKSRMCRQRFADLNPQRRIFFFFGLSLSGFHHFTQPASPAVSLDKSLLSLPVTLAPLLFCFALASSLMIFGPSLVSPTLISCRYRDSNYFLVRYPTKVNVACKKKKKKTLSCSCTLIGKCCNSAERSHLFDKSSVNTSQTLRDFRLIKNEFARLLFFIKFLGGLSFILILSLILFHRFHQLK